MWQSSTSADVSCPAPSRKPPPSHRDRQLCRDGPAAVQRSHSFARYLKTLHIQQKLFKIGIRKWWWDCIILFPFQVLAVPWQVFLCVLVLLVPQLTLLSPSVVVGTVFMTWTSTPSLLRKWPATWIPQPLVNVAPPPVVMLLQTRLLIKGTGCYELIADLSSVVSREAERTADEDRCLGQPLESSSSSS